MCGIAGFWSPAGFSTDLAMLQATRMSDALTHRGPNDAGVWVDDVAGIALAHRRLAIVDLSPAGHQPMVSHCGRYVMVFNGEVYNHSALRSELCGIDWRGQSDTETLLQAIARWGVDEALRRSVGMFALAVWDRAQRSLSLARDRIGEKPLYYGWQRGVLLFGSELKALRQHPSFEGDIDRNSLTLLLRHNNIAAPYSVYRGICKLPPATVLTLDAGPHVVQPVPYWSLKGVAQAGQARPFQGSEAEAADELERLLDASLAGQMLADVPLGAFLSGGIDSSTVVALMQARSTRPVKTFSIGFHEAGYNEAHQAAAVAHHLGTEHTELYVTAEEAMAVIPRLPSIYDEPFADSSQIPTVLVSQLAGRHVTVALSGDAGDELFGGYNRYMAGPRLARKVDWLAPPLRRVLANGLSAVPASVWDGLGRVVGQAALSERARKLCEIFAAKDRETMYRQLISHWKAPQQVVLGAHEPPTVLTSRDDGSHFPDFEHRMMYLDTLLYLPDDILVKVDRAAMSASLETRVPMLDHRIVEFAWQLPMEFKIQGGQGKRVLRGLLERYVPKAMFDRPKMGFGVPIGEWLRGPLRGWAEELLSETRLRQEGYFEPITVRRKWVEHLSGAYNWQYYLWDVLMFQAWLEHEQAT